MHVGHLQTPFSNPVSKIATRINTILDVCKRLRCARGLDCLVAFLARPLVIHSRQSGIAAGDSSAHQSAP